MSEQPKPVTAPTEKEKRRRQPWHPPEYTRADIRALQAIGTYASGMTETPPSPQDCERALRWIVEVAAGAYEETFYAGQPDVGDYLAGRRSVGLAVVKLMKMKPEVIND